VAFCFVPSLCPSGAHRIAAVLRDDYAVLCPGAVFRARRGDHCVIGPMVIHASGVGSDWPVVSTARRLSAFCAQLVPQPRGEVLIDCCNPGLVPAPAQPGPAAVHRRTEPLSRYSLRPRSSWFAVMPLVLRSCRSTQSASFLNGAAATVWTTRAGSPRRQRMIDDMRKLGPRTREGCVRVIQVLLVHKKLETASICPDRATATCCAR
jgi:hypothetical protein